MDILDRALLSLPLTAFPGQRPHLPVPTLLLQSTGDGEEKGCLALHRGEARGFTSRLSRPLVESSGVPRAAFLNPDLTWSGASHGPLDHRQVSPLCPLRKGLPKGLLTPVTSAQNLPHSQLEGLSGPPPPPHCPAVAPLPASPGACI